eukprot:3156137-Amphidinium_carterae.1
MLHVEEEFSSLPYMYSKHKRVSYYVVGVAQDMGRVPLRPNDQKQALVPWLRQLPWPTICKIFSMV